MLMLVCSECNGEYPESDFAAVVDDYQVCEDCREIMLAFIARISGDRTTS
jgi:hypothetical protein